MTPTDGTDPAPETVDDRVIARLISELATVRTRYANLVAAARATLSAAREDDETYALTFLAGELACQHGQRDIDRGAWGRWRDGMDW